MAFPRLGRYTGTLAVRDAFLARTGDFWVVTDGNRGTFVYDGSNWLSCGQNLLTHLPDDPDVQGDWHLTWNGATELPILTDESSNGYDFDTITGTVMMGMVGNLVGTRFADGSANHISGPTGQTNLQITGDVTMEFLMQWDGGGSNSAILAGFGGTGETEVENQLYSVTNGSADLGLRWFHEFGAGSNTTPLLPKAETPKGKYTYLAVVRDTAANTVKAYYDANLAETAGYTNEATGGGNGFMSACIGAVNDVTLAQIVVSDTARTQANITLRAQQCGVI